MKKTILLTVALSVVDPAVSMAEGAAPSAQKQGSLSYDIKIVNAAAEGEAPGTNPKIESKVKSAMQMIHEKKARENAERDGYRFSLPDIEPSQDDEVIRFIRQELKLGRVLDSNEKDWQIVIESKKIAMDGKTPTRWVIINLRKKGNFL